MYSRVPKENKAYRKDTNLKHQSIFIGKNHHFFHQRVEMFNRK